MHITAFLFHSAQPYSTFIIFSNNRNFQYRMYLFRILTQTPGVAD